MTRPEWLTQELETKALAMLDGAHLHVAGADGEKPRAKDVLYDDGTYQLVKSSSRAVMELTNTAENVHPDANEMIALAAAIAWVRRSPIKLDYASDADGIYIKLDVAENASPESIRERFSRDEAKYHAHNMPMWNARDALIARLKQIGDFRVTPASPIDLLKHKGFQAFEITFAETASHAALTHAANAMHNLCNADEKTYRAADTSLAALLGLEESREPIMVGVKKGSATTLLVHVPLSYELSLSAFTHLQMQAQHAPTGHSGAAR